MSTHKYFDKLCCVVLAFTLLLSVLFMNAEAFGVKKTSSVMGYEKKLFDTSKVHTVNIIMDDWEEFTANCKSEEYFACTVVIDNEAYKNVAIRGKGNTSLSQVTNDRYSYKIEFDHYDSTTTYHGLDKLCLNNIIQDHTYMKDYLCYQMMNEMGVASPLCSYAYITVNGEDWGLYLAVEGVEESFLQRNYGKDFGALYKPDSMDIGGGHGDGNMEMPQGERPDGNMEMPQGEFPGGNMEMPQGERPDGNMEMPQGERPDGNMEMPQGEHLNGSMQMPQGENALDKIKTFGGENTKAEDVLLKYIDENIESYANIFENAKTQVSENDKNRLIQSLKNLSNGENISDTVDIDKVIRYFVVHNFVLNFDSYTGSMIHNYYLYEKNGQMQMIPWDYNLAFGGFMSMGGAESLVNYPIDSPVSGNSIEDRPMLAWIFANEEYTEQYHEYFDEFVTQYFETGYFEEMMDNVQEMISPYVEKDPTKFCTFEEFEKGIETLKEFCLLRAQSIRGQLDGTIGSTSETQNRETLINSGEIQIEDMGSMGDTMGGGRFSGFRDQK